MQLLLTCEALEHGIKVVKRVFEKRLHGIVTVNEMQFGFESGTIVAVFISRQPIEHIGLKKAVDRVSRKVWKWAVRKKRMPEVLVRSVVSLYW